MRTGQMELGDREGEKGRMQLQTNCLYFILPGLFLSRKPRHAQNTTLATCQLNTTLGLLACLLAVKKNPPDGFLTYLSFLEYGVFLKCFY